MKTPNDRLAKIYANCTGHMTKMATMLIYVNGQWPWDLVCIIGDVGPTRCTNDESRLTLTYIMARSN